MSEMDEYKKRRQEAMEARKIRQEMPDGVLPEPQYAEHIEPKTFKEKWQNYWYHYKWRTIVVAFFCLLGIAMIWQFGFPQKYDTSLSIVTQWPMELYQQQIMTPVQELMPDYDENGKKELNCLTYQVSSPDGSLSADIEQSSYARLIGTLSEGQHFIYLVDDAGYDYLLSLEIPMLDLTEYADADRLKGNDRYQFLETKLGASMELEKELGELTLCFLDPAAYGERIEEKDISQAYERQWDMFQLLLAAE